MALDDTSSSRLALDHRGIALLPLRWNLVKLARHWDRSLAAVEQEAPERLRELEAKHKSEHVVLRKQLEATKEAEKKAIPLNGRLKTLHASYDNLRRLGRLEKAQQVKLKLDPLEARFWKEQLAATGFLQNAVKKRGALKAKQVFERSTLARETQMTLQELRQKRDAEIKGERRACPCSSDNMWSICYAAKAGEMDRLRLILGRSPKRVGERDPDSGWTPLHFASRAGHREAVQLLLDAQAFVGARTPNGRTPLHLAAGCGTYEVCLLLLTAGADKNVLDDTGQTPEALAESRGRDRSVRLLRRWKQLGLTVTETEKIATDCGPPRAWELEKNASIRSQLRAVEMKEEANGRSHPGLLTNMGRLAALYRQAGRIEESVDSLQRCLSLLGEARKTGRRPGGSGTEEQEEKEGAEGIVQVDHALTEAVTLNNLGEAYHELGQHEDAASYLERAMEAVTSLKRRGGGEGGGGRRGRGPGAACRGGAATAATTAASHAAARNLGLHLLSVGRVDEAEPPLRVHLGICEAALAPDLASGDECVELIEALDVLSYVQLLKGDHKAALEGYARALRIASCRHGEKGVAVAPRLSNVGLAHFAVGDYDAAEDFFRQARVVLLGGGRGEFDEEVACADRNIAVTVCRRGPGAF